MAEKKRAGKTTIAQGLPASMMRRDPEAAVLALQQYAAPLIAQDAIAARDARADAMYETTMTAGRTVVGGVQNLLTMPGRVYSGEVNPNSPEAARWAAMAGLTMAGSGVAAPRGVIGSGASRPASSGLARADYLDGLNQAVGKTSFGDWLTSLERSSLSAKDVQSIAREITGETASRVRSRTEALKRLWNFHQGLVVMQKKMAATAGRSAG